VSDCVIPQQSNAKTPPVMAVIAAEGRVLDRVLGAMNRTARDGLNRQACGMVHTAQTKTSWGGRCQTLYALVNGEDVFASAEKYDLTGILDGRRVPVCGIGRVLNRPSRSGRHHAHVLVERLFDEGARQGAEIGLLFSNTGEGDTWAGDFRTLRFTDVTLRVAESPRHGAPMTTVRGGEERDLAAVAAMGRVRAEPFRFHFDRDVDFIRYAITTKRLLAGLGPPDFRQLQFFIAEEDMTAAAYVVLSVVGNVWTLEECGDRDPSGARVGALLQTVIAREPGGTGPTIRAWLPARFLPPQVTIISATPSTQTVTMRMLDRRATAPSLSSDDVLFWRDDLL
jgi:hypothetical protein